MPTAKSNLAKAPQIEAAMVEEAEVGRFGRISVIPFYIYMTNSFSLVRKE
jgi:hypothetical protein